MFPNSGLCPPHVAKTIDLYVEHGLEPGSFTRACLENNLREAVLRADSLNMANIPHIVAYMWNKIPAECWGSPSRVDSWLTRKAKERAQAPSTQQTPP